MIIDDKTVHAMLKAIDENIHTCDWVFKGEQSDFIDLFCVSF